VSLLRIDNLGKAYRTYRSEWQRFASWFGVPVTPLEEHWVLRNVSFAIEPGEAIGIVGQNGAGKSTLLKMITGTLQPTEGSVQVNGRIAAILELGMGFNPELTGRQNVVHAAGLMGFSADQIGAALPDIEAFAEIGHYFDEPIRTYSSGMQMRLAFAVATAYRPDVLIVDEALSVGDLYFQHKSFGRIRQFRAAGTTLLIVSHDRGSIQALCDRALLLDRGAVIKDGEPEAVMDYYNALIADQENARIDVSTLANGSIQTRSGTNEASVLEVSLHNAAGERVEHVAVGQDVVLRVVVGINSTIPELVVGYLIKDRLGQPVFGTNTHFLGCIQSDLRTNERLEYRFEFAAGLGVGSYSVAVALHTAETHLERNYEWRDHSLLFTVVNLAHPTFTGLAWIPPEVEVSR
jgi:lipopolysaccharide transport system ATP-binding protein